MEPAGADARSQPRARVSWRAQVIVAGRAIDGRTTDISEGGVGLKLADNVPIGQAVKVMLQVPDPKSGGPGQMVSGTIRVAFSVLSQDGVRMGGPWLELPPAARTLLSGFVRQQIFKF